MSLESFPLKWVIIGLLILFALYLAGSAGLNIAAAGKDAMHSKNAEYELIKKE